MSTNFNADGFSGDQPKKSANQLYKESGTKKPFKDWLKDMQSDGYLNADAITPSTGVKQNYDVEGDPNASSAAPAATKKPFDLNGLLGTLGQVAQVGAEIGMNIKNRKDQQKLENIAAHDTTFTGNKGGGSEDKKPDPKTLGVSSIVWWGIGGTVVLIGGFLVYKNFFATGDGAAPAPAAA